MDLEYILDQIYGFIDDKRKKIEIERQRFKEEYEQCKASDGWVGSETHELSSANYPSTFESSVRIEIHECWDWSKPDYIFFKLLVDCDKETFPISVRWLPLKEDSLPKRGRGRKNLLYDYRQRREYKNLMITSGNCKNHKNKELQRTFDLFLLALYAKRDYVLNDITFKEISESFHNEISTVLIQRKILIDPNLLINKIIANFNFPFHANTLIRYLLKTGRLINKRDYDSDYTPSNDSSSIYALEYFTGIPKATIYSMIQRGKLKAIRDMDTGHLILTKESVYKLWRLKEDMDDRKEIIKIIDLLSEARGIKRGSLIKKVYRWKKKGLKNEEIKKALRNKNILKDL